METDYLIFSNGNNDIIIELFCKTGINMHPVFNVNNGKYKCIGQLSKLHLQKLYNKQRVIFFLFILLSLFFQG